MQEIQDKAEIKHFPSFAKWMTAKSNEATIANSHKRKLGQPGSVSAGILHYYIFVTKSIQMDPSSIPSDQVGTSQCQR